MAAVIEIVGVVAVALLAFWWLRGTSIYKAHRRNGFHPVSGVTRDREQLLDHRTNRYQRNMWGPLPKHGKTDTGFRKRRP
jgi:hypothetical protein